MTYSGIRYDWLGEYGDREVQYTICTRKHILKNHKYEVTSCITKKCKIFIYVISKCANCGGNYQATTFKCLTRQKAQSKTWGKKTQKISNKEE